MGYNWKSKVDNARETDPARLAAYKFYNGTLTGDLAIDARTVLGDRYGVGGYIKNDGANTFTVTFSVDDGSTYGDEITLDTGEMLNFDDFIIFTHVKLVHTSNSDYRVLIY